MNNSKGFTLIEVLVAMVLLAVGLLGLAGLQVTSLSNNQSAYNRSQATELAYDLADRMRANVAGRATYASIAPTDAAAKPTCLNVASCNTATMAENDLYEWNLAVTNSLPAGSGTIATIGGNVYTITITWDDDRDSNAENNLSFQTSFQL